MSFGFRAILCFVLSALNAFLVSMGPADAQALCVGKGHVAFESLGRGTVCCAKATASAGPGASGQTACGSCVDIPVIVDVRMPHVKAPAASTSIHPPVLLPALFAQALPTTAPTHLVAFDPSPPSNRSQIASLRTVVLLI